jgi:hypothetical protein
LKLEKLFRSVELAGLESGFAGQAGKLTLVFPEDVANLFTTVSAVIRSFRRQIRI